MSRTVRSAGEHGLIDYVQRCFATTDESVRTGIGDDTAILAPQDWPGLVATTDAMMEGVHFDRSYCPPGAVGAKLVAVNVSDIAAMGARPNWMLLTCSFPAELPLDWARQLLDGIAVEARRYGAAVVGGDVTGSPGPVSLSLAAIGHLVGPHALLRNAAIVGDTVYVTGALGAAGLGLRALEGTLAEPDDVPGCVRAFLAPTARLEEGVRLAAWGHCHAAMDLSDGLAVDAARMARASDVTIEIELGCLPVHEELATQVPELAERLALFGGEDYELIFTADEKPPVRCTAIGRVVAGAPGVRWLRQGDDCAPPAPAGFDHFK